MKVYNELLYNNLEGFLLACFPVCRKILGKRRWDRLARAFFRDHACHTPYFRQIPEEFLKYLQAAGSPPRTSRLPAGTGPLRMGGTGTGYLRPGRGSCHPTIRPAIPVRAGPC
jgi:hypothetical protein